MRRSGIRKDPGTGRYGVPVAGPPRPERAPEDGRERRGPRRRLAAIVSGAAAAGVAASLVLLGAVPGFTPFAHGAGSPPSDDATTALALAGPLASAYDAGALVAVAGLVTTYAYGFGELAGAVDPSCAVSHPLFENISVPADGGGYDSGLAPAWIVAYANTTAGTESYLAVLGPEVYFLGTLSGASCAAGENLSAISLQSVSSEKAASAANGGAGAFLAAHPSANAVYLLLENTTTSEPVWEVAYTNCSYDPGTGGLGGGEAGDLFLAEVNASDGVVIASTYSPGVANCSAGLGGVTSLSTASFDRPLGPEEARPRSTDGPAP